MSYNPAMLAEVAAGATLDETARKHETTRANVAEVVGIRAIRDGYAARYRARWGEDPPPTRKPPDNAIRDSVIRVLGHPLRKVKGTKNRMSAATKAANRKAKTLFYHLSQDGSRSVKTKAG